MRNNYSILSYLLFLFIFLSCSDLKFVEPDSDLSHGWVVQAPANGINRLCSIDFSDDNHGWIVGNDSTILKTSDGGQSWEVEKSILGSIHIKVDFQSPDIGYIATQYGSILGTKDGGESWEVQYSEDDFWVNDFQFTDINHGWICGAVKNSDTSNWIGMLLKTSDGGEHWEEVIRTYDTVGQSIYGMSFLDSLHGFLTAQYVYGVMYTEDGGKTWDLREPLQGCFSDIQFFNDSVGFAYWLPGGVYGTLDGGKSWELKIGTGIILGMDFLDERTGWICGVGGYLAHTEDGGATWDICDTNYDNQFEEVRFFTKDHGWVVGEGGIILTTFDGGDSWESIVEPTINYLSTVKMSDKNHGFAAGKDGTVLFTQNGGDDWNLANTNTVRNLNSAVCAESYRWLITGDDGVLLESTDQGRNWMNITTGLDVNLKDIYVSSDNFWCVVGGKYIARTTNEGRNWKIDSVTFDLSNDQLMAVKFLNNEIGWSLSRYGEIYKTTNSAESWEELNNLYDSCFANDFYFINENHGFIVGDPITFYETTDGGRNWHWVMFEDFPFYSSAIEFTDSLNGMVIGYKNGIEKGVIYKTSDGGKTWDLVTDEIRNHLYDIDFVDGKRGWISGSNGMILHTTNGGLDF